MPARQASDRTVRLRAAELLGLDVVSAEELADRLSAQGVELGPDEAERLGRVLDQSSSFVELDRGGYSSRRCSTAPPGARPSPRTTPPPGSSALDPDLALLGWLALDETLHIADPAGALAALVATDDDGLLGPDGWLKGLGGRTIGVGTTGTTLELAPVDDVDVDQALATAVRRAFDAHASREQLVQTFPTEAVFELVHISLADLLWRHSPTTGRRSSRHRSLRSTSCWRRPVSNGATTWSLAPASIGLSSRAGTGAIAWPACTMSLLSWSTKPSSCSG